MNIAPRTVFLAAMALCPCTQAQTDAVQRVRFEPQSVNFRSVGMGRCKPTKVDAVNASDEAITDPAFRLEGSSAFSLQRRGKCPNPLPPGQFCRAYVNFCPPLFKTYDAELFFSASDSPVPVTGRGFQGGR